MYKLFSLVVVMLLWVACQTSVPVKETALVNQTGDTILVNEKSPVLGHIVTQQSYFQAFSKEFRTIGTVGPVSGKIAEIAPPFAGRIIKLHIRLGQKISAGSTVFELGSSEFYEATKAYFAAQSANELAQIKYSRQKGLAAYGVAAQKDLEEAQSEAEITSQEYEQAKATLRMFNVDVATLQMGQPLKVVAPISGEVVKSNITIGSYAREDSEPLAVIADFSHVWVTALVKEKYIGAIKKGDQAEVFITNDHQHSVKGTIYYIGEMLEEETRSLEVIIECNNGDRMLKPGMFCEVKFMNSPTSGIILPSTAIMKDQDNDYVLIEMKKGLYLRRLVQCETINTDSVHISEGIGEGENVVIRGGIYLNY